MPPHGIHSRTRHIHAHEVRIRRNEGCRVRPGQRLEDGQKRGGSPVRREGAACGRIAAMGHENIDDVRMSLGDCREIDIVARPVGKHPEACLLPIVSERPIDVRHVLPGLVDHREITHRVRMGEEMLEGAADDHPARYEQQGQNEPAGPDILQELASGDEEDCVHAAAVASATPATAMKASCRVGSAASNRIGLVPRAMQAASR